MRSRILIIIVFITFFSVLSSSQEAGQTAPELSGFGNDGKRYSLSQFRGKVVLLKFWYSACHSCSDSMTYTQYLYKKYSRQGLVLFLVSVGSSIIEDSEYLRLNNILSTVSVFRRGLNMRNYSIRVFPFEYIIDKNGMIRWSGGQNMNENILVDLLK